MNHYNNHCSGDLINPLVELGKRDVFKIFGRSVSVITELRYNADIPTFGCRASLLYFAVVTARGLHFCSIRCSLFHYSGLLSVSRDILSPEPRSVTSRGASGPAPDLSRMDAYFGFQFLRSEYFTWRDGLSSGGVIYVVGLCAECVPGDGCRQCRLVPPRPDQQHGQQWPPGARSSCPATLAAAGAVTVWEAGLRRTGCRGHGRAILPCLRLLT